MFIYLIFSFLYRKPLSEGHLDPVQRIFEFKQLLVALQTLVN